MKGKGFQQHFKIVHVQKEGLFKQPFPYQDCRRLGRGDTCVDGTSEWGDHVLLAHNSGGKTLSPSEASTLTSRGGGNQQVFRGKKRKIGETGPNSNLNSDARSEDAEPVLVPIDPRLKNIRGKRCKLSSAKGSDDL
jgi:hypothetical protein